MSVGGDGVRSEFVGMGCGQNLLEGMGCGQNLLEGMGCGQSLFMPLCWRGWGVVRQIVHATLLEAMGCGQGPQLVVRPSKVIVLCWLLWRVLSVLVVR